MKSREGKTKKKYVETNGGTRDEILLEIQRDVNILLYIEAARQSEKVFSGEVCAQAVSLSTFSGISLSFFVESSPVSS